MMRRKGEKERNEEVQGMGAGNSIQDRLNEAKQIKKAREEER